MRKKEFNILKVVLVFCLMFTLSLGGGHEAQAGNLKIASFSLGTSWYNYGNAMAQQIRKGLPDYTVDVLPFAGGAGNLRLIQEKKADMGLIFDCQLAWAYNGEASYKGKPDKNLRQLVGSMDKYYIVFVAQKGFAAKSFDEIIQKKLPVKFCTLPEGGSAIIALRQLFEVKGISESDFKSWGGSIKFANSPPALSAMLKTGQADIWIQPAPKGHPTVTELAQTEEVVFIPIENDTVEKMKTKFYYENVVMPKGIFRGQEDTRSLGFSTAIGVMADMNEDVAYKSTKAIYENRKQMSALDAGLKDFEMTKDSLGYVPLHQGAERYFKEIGLVK